MQQNNCQTEINAINTVMQQLMSQQGNAQASLQAATIGHHSQLISYWQNQLNLVLKQIAVLTTRLNATKARCNSTARYSGYTPTQDDLTNIYSQCGQLYPNDQGQYDDCVAGATSALEQSDGSTSGTNPNPTTTSSSGGFFGSVSDAWGWLKKALPGGGTTTKPATPPVANNNLIFGLSPSIAIPLGILAVGLVVWGIVAYNKEEKSQ